MQDKSCLSRAACLVQERCVPPCFGSGDIGLLAFVQLPACLSWQEIGLDSVQLWQMALLLKVLWLSLKCLSS